MATSRPSWRTSLLGILGFIDLPVKVNCWYCNQDTCLVPGSRQTERYWHCNICENTNIRDEHGEIVDSVPVMFDASLNRPITPVQTSTRSTSTPSSSRMLCENCQRNQSLIYQIMSDYIRDENDPEYNFYVRTADDYQRSLHEKYPLCDDCQAKVDGIVAEQKAILQQRRFNEKLTRSMTTKAPRKPSFYEYISRGSLWVFIHVLFLFICAAAYRFPPTRPEPTNVYSDLATRWHNIIAATVAMTAHWKSRYSWDSAIVAMVHDSISHVTNALTTMVQWLFRLTICFCYNDIDNIGCSWNLSDISMLVVLFFTLSFLWMDWHYRASKTFFEPFRIKRWSLYKLAQRVLYVWRLGFLGVLAYADDRWLHMTAYVTLIAYPLILVTSMFVVKVASSRWPLKRVGSRGTLHTLKKTYSDLHNFAADRVTKIGKESLEAARYTPPYNSQESFDNDNEEDDEVVAAVKRAIDSKREKYNLRARSSTTQKPTSDSYDDNDVEGLAAGIFKMDFNKA
ncbi:hypothetical protein O0I10_006773 [Lichtheimia ornata]|uniref:Ima1 N-terminal domain-containing protein n=1 Tax=Lichtheimia ornata TaxID=688661 RepID=A0AAD7XYF9_9FUNG|nr:uncharacterized protein O0I10_006773 [Lichtheimia ornata]KAJ8657471.1 hypothetical protein O0I10_006773 [Lichtheimia ornata]